MAYYIQYGQVSGKTYTTAGRSGRLGWLICGAALVFLLVTHLFWPEGKQALQEILFPGDWEKTADAVSGMIAQLGQGETVQDAVAAFCRELLDHEGA